LACAPRIHVANFVEEDCALVGQFEFTQFALDRPVNAPFSKPKSSLSKSPSGYRAIQLDHRFAGAGAVSDEWLERPVPFLFRFRPR